MHPITLPHGLRYLPENSSIPNNNQSRLHKLSAICSAEYESMSLFQVLSLITTSYNSENCRMSFNNSLKYFFGENWHTILIEKNFIKNGPISFVHFYYIPSNTDILAIRGIHGAPDWALLADLIANQQIPDLIYQYIPGINIILDYIQPLLLKVYEISRQIFDHRPLLFYYTDYLIDYVEKQNWTEKSKVLFVGHSVGGVLAKLLTVKYSHESIAVGSAKVMVPYIMNLGVKSQEMRLVSNILSEGDLLSRIDFSHGTNFIIPTIASILMRNCAFGVLCMTSIACSKGHLVEGFCNQTIGNNLFLQMNSYWEKTRKSN